MAKPMIRQESRGKELARTGKHDDRHRDRKRSPFTFDLIPGTLIDEYIGPYFVGLLLVPGLGYLAHKYWTGWIAVLFTVVIVAGCSALLYWAEEDMSARKPRVKMRVRASIIGVCGSVIVSMWVGPFVRIWLDMQIVGTLFLCGTWTIATTKAVRGNGDDAHDQRDMLADQLSWDRRTTAELVSSDGPKKEWRIHHRFNTPKQIQASLAILAVRLGSRNVQITIDPENEDDPGVSRLVAVQGNPLREPALWPGPSAPGADLHVPCVVGVYADGEPVSIMRPGDPTVPRACVMTMISGMQGTGKTRLSVAELAELVTREGVFVCWVDTEKWNAEKRVIGPAVGWPETTVDGAREMLRALIRAMRVRVDVMAEHGFSEWTPEVYRTLGIPFVVAIFEEIGSIIMSIETEFHEVIKLVRSSGMSITGSQQRNSAATMPTDIRSLFSLNACFGVRTAQDAVMALSKETLDAGAAPDAWSTHHPGRFYIEPSHVDQSRWSMDARTFRLDNTVLAAHFAEWGPRMAKLDPWTEAAFGDAYRNRNRDNTPTETATVVSVRTAPPSLDDAIRDVMGDEELPAEPGRVPLEYDRAETAGVRLGDGSSRVPTSQERDAAFMETLGLLLGERDSVSVTTEQIMDTMFSKGLPPHLGASVHTRIRGAIKERVMTRLEKGRYRIERRPGDSRQ